MSPYETSFALIREKLCFSRPEFYSRLDWLSTHILNPRNLSIAGGDEEDRTPDPLRARQVLSQLSYTPESCGVSERRSSLFFLRILSGPSKSNNMQALNQALTG